MSYPVITISPWGKVRQGVIVGTFSPRHNEESPAICLGHHSHGGCRSMVPVKLKRNEYKEWSETGFTIIFSASIKKTKMGGSYLVSAKEATTTKKSIVVVTTGGRLTGQMDGDLFPGRILARGLVTEGDLAPAPGEQIMAVVPDEALFRVAWDSSEIFCRVFRGEIQIIPSQPI